jgi:hypothetical protein
MSVSSKHGGDSRASDEEGKTSVKVGKLRILNLHSWLDD